MKSRCLSVVGMALLIGFLFLAGAEAVSAASEFPTRPVEVIICFAPGGTLDVAVRIMGEELSKTLGVPAMLTNKGGGGGAVGTEFAANAKPDGYTVLAAPIGVFNILPFLTPNLRYKLSDFIPVCKYANSPNLIFVKKGSKYKTFNDILTDAKKNPGKLTCATAGMGTAAHFSLEMIKLQAGIDVAHLPYKSGAEVITSLMGGQVDFITQGLPPAVGLLKSGDLVGLASTLGKIPGFPNIPTMAELGYPRATLGVWVGYFLPKGVPTPVVNKLASAFEKAIKSPAVKKGIEDTAQVLDYMDSADFAKFMAAEYAMLEEVAKKANLIKK
ncbi:MAG: tripartite tricarboxylate transporter substrate binding protein [Pseudomonadota bacterium]